MDSPLPLLIGANYAISLDEGYVDETLGSTTPGQGNTIDIRGSGSNLFSLGGSQFGTRVLTNYLAGNNFYAESGAQGNVSGPYSPFINPNHPGQTSLPWGWTHTPGSWHADRRQHVCRSHHDAGRSGNDGRGPFIESPLECRPAILYRPARKQRFRRFEARHPVPT